MASSQDWIFTKAYIDDLNDKEVINHVVGKRKEYISKTVWLIEDIARSLQLDRKVVSTAVVYFHRFYMFHSFNDQKRLPVAVACLFLASKAEEKPIKLREIIGGFQAVYSPSKPLDVDFQKHVLLAERILLNTLGFELNVAHPLMACTAKVKDLKAYASDETTKSIYQSAVNFINDSYRSSLCLQYSAPEIGLSLLFMATCQVGNKPVMPAGRPGSTTWLEILTKDVCEETLCSICLQMLEFYENEAYLTQTQPTTLQTLQKATFEHLGVMIEGSTPRTLPPSPSQPASPSPSHTDTDLDDYDKRYDEKCLENNLSKPKVMVTRVNPTDSVKPRSSSMADPDTPFTIETPSSVCYADDTPTYTYMKQETPSSTPTFADLPSMRRRERAYSQSEDSVGGDECKRPRAH